MCLLCSLSMRQVHVDVVCTVVFLVSMTVFIIGLLFVAYCLLMKAYERNTFKAFSYAHLMSLGE